MLPSSVARCPFAAHRAVVTGRLARHTATGGEATGLAIVSRDGDLYQLDLRDLENPAQVELWIGRQVQFGGIARCLEGVEGGWRRVLVADAGGLVRS